MTEEETQKWADINKKYFTIRKEWLKMYDYLNHKYPDWKKWNIPNE